MEKNTRKRSATRTKSPSNTEIWEAIKPRKKIVRKRSNLNGHALPVCESGKLRYRDRTQAQDALTVAKHRGVTARGYGEATSRNERRAYCCPICSGWHLTSQPGHTVEVGA